MNDRYRHLAYETLLRTGAPTGNDEWQQIFVELIVRECATVANRAENNETEIRCMYDVITQHFGVE